MTTINYFINYIDQSNTTRFLCFFQYLTTVIPYHTDSGPPDNQALQVLIKSKCIC